MDIRERLARLQDSIAHIHDEFRFERDPRACALHAHEVAKNPERKNALAQYLRIKFGWRGNSPAPKDAPEPWVLAPNVPPAPAKVPFCPKPVASVAYPAHVKAPTVRGKRVVVTAQAGRRKREVVPEPAPKAMGLLTTSQIGMRESLTRPDQSPRPAEFQVQAGAAIAPVVQLERKEPDRRFCRLVPDHKRGCWYRIKAEPVVMFDAVDNVYRVNESRRVGRQKTVTRVNVESLANAWGARIV